MKWEIRQPEEDFEGFMILKQICVQLAHRTNTHTVIMLWKIQEWISEECDAGWKSAIPNLADHSSNQ